MAVGAQRLPVEALADAAGRVAAAGDLRAALSAISAAIAEAVSADLVVVRVLDAEGRLAARAAAPDGSSAAAEALGTRVSCERAAAGGASDVILRAAERLRAGGVAVVAARAGGEVVGAIEVLRQDTLGEVELALLELAAAQLALAVRTLSPGSHAASSLRRSAWLERAGEALAAGADAGRAGHELVRIAVEAAGARGGVLWRLDADGGRVRIASLGDADALLLDEPPGAVSVVELGRPPFAALELLHAEDVRPTADDLDALAAFAARAAQALRSSERARAVELELERTRSLLSVVSEAVSRLSLAHTLETAVERVAELLQVERVGIYLYEDGGLEAAAGRLVAAAHAEVAARLSDALQGPLRARPSVRTHLHGVEPALAGARAALAAAGESSAVAVPLNVREEPVGVLVVFPGERELPESDGVLLAALASLLAAAVQNARLHERATELGVELGSVLEAERTASRQVGALYEISRSFAQTMSLAATLEAVTQTLVAQLAVDAAVIRVPDERGVELVPRAVHVADSRFAAAVRTILERPQPLPARTPLEPVLLDAADLARLGGAHALLGPFLAKGSTAALVPLASASGLLAELTLVSLNPAAPISAETLATARSIAQQAALAIDNARLYQLQKQFAETMQQSLLPRERPSVHGLEIGHVYEPAAELEVGGDVYDFLELPDGRLAVVLGDVTGHGVEATADMAMAKFVFRSLARVHPSPDAFLALANDIVVDEVQPGKFITMVYVTVGSDGDVLCASGGHPAPRVVLPDGTVHALEVGGLALGIDAAQEYLPTRAELPPGAAVVLYTDGVVESRRDGRLFGVERLDEVLAASAGSPAQAIADAVLDASRSFAGGNLADDCAVVVIARTAA
jgi:serine phosphatase RsbU (regulator of sigma subunit)